MENPALISKPEMLKMVGMSYVTVWHKMIADGFPRGVMVANKTFWVKKEVEAWHKAFLARAPRQVLLGDPKPAARKKSKAGAAK